MVNVKIWTIRENGTSRKWFDENVYSVDVENEELTVIWSTEDNDYSVLCNIDERIRINVSEVKE